MRNPNKFQINNTDAVRRIKSFSTNIKNKYLRGLRLWVHPRNPLSGPLQIGMFDFSPLDRSEIMNTLFRKVNKSLKSSPIAGRILNLETIVARTKSGKVNSSSTYWQEYSSKTREFGFFLRLFFVETFPAHEEIAFKDFVPKIQTPGTFSALMEKVNNWLSSIEASSHRMINVQTLQIKQKGYFFNYICW